MPRRTWSTWATGCGFSGRVSPFGGRAKLVWNVDWAARWGLVGATIEGCGKDLATAGGSRDRADAISRRVFDREPPLNVPYEFLNIGGKKMSTSQGLRRGRARDRRDPAARAAALPVPAPQAATSAIEFDPEGDTIPRPVRRVRPDCRGRGRARGARRAAGRPGAVFRTSLVDAEADPAAVAAEFRPAFRHLAAPAPDPGVDVDARITAEKGAPLTSDEVATLRERIAAADAWLERSPRTRPGSTVQRDGLPAAAAALEPDQRAWLAALAEPVAGGQPVASGADWQALIFSTAAAAGLPAGRAFSALYLAFLGRSNGPRAGWLLASLEPDFVHARLLEAAGLATPAGQVLP